jgi:site-specific recombinase XerD
MDAKLESYLSELPRLYRSERTVEQYRHKLKSFARWLDEKGYPLDADALSAYVYQRLRADRMRARTVRSLRPALSGYFKWLKKRHPAEEVPDLDAVTWPSLDAPQRYVPTDADLDALFQAAARMPAHTPGKAFRRARALAILALFRYAGLRRQELIDLRVQDIDTSAERWRVYIAFGKGGKPDWINVNPELHQHLAVWLEIRKEWAKGRLLGPESKASLWPIDGRRHLEDRGITALFRDLVEMAGLSTNITPHCLRHWYATALAKTTSIANVSRLMRHSNIAVTLDYLHWDTEAMDAALDGLGQKNGKSGGNVRSADAGSKPASNGGDPKHETSRLRRRPGRGR